MKDLRPFLARVTKEQFLARVRIGDGCWEWTGHTRPGKWGYGIFNLWGAPSPLRAHRISWTLYRGTIPDGLLVLHRCDNPKCVNPDHLFLGTAGDNWRDALEKGRAAQPEWNRVVNGKCANGHVRDSVYVRRGIGACRKCVLAATHRYRAKKRRLQQAAL